MNGHKVILSGSGISVTDGVNSGNLVVLDGNGVTIKDRNGNTIAMAGGGIKIGGSATEPLVLGMQFQARVQAFVTALSAHTHTGSPGGPPMVPAKLDVPLSSKHKVE